jgi:hypothetical protein
MSAIRPRIHLGSPLRDRVPRMTPDWALLVGFMTVTLAGPSCLAPEAVFVDAVRWIGRILRIFVPGST